MILEKWLLMSRNVYNPAGGQRLFLAGRANPTGQLGFNATTRVDNLTQLGSLSWSQISAGRSHTVAIRSDGLLFTWGSNYYGSLGTGFDQRGNWRSSPVQIGTDSWSFVDARGFHTMAIRSDGLLFGWGDTGRGQLGDGTQFNDERVSNDWSRADNSIFLKTNGTLWTMGPIVAKLGRPATAYDTYSPVQVGSDTNWAKISSGTSHAAAIKTDGSLYVWGINASGQVGDGTTINRSSPVQIGTSSWTMVNCGADHTTAITTDGKLFVWGANQAGQLGDSTVVFKSSPIQIAAANTWSNVSAGVTHSAAIRNDGMLFTWGNNLFGQLGNGSIANTSSPVQVGTSSWTVISASGFNTHAIRLGGGLFGWGRNDNGTFLVGDGTATHRSSPVQIAASNTFTTVSSFLSTATIGRMFAIDSTTSLYRWGNRNGFNNISSGGDISVPTIVGAGNLGTTPATGWTDVDANLPQAINSGIVYHWSVFSADQKYEDFFFGTSTPQNGVIVTPFGRAARRYSPVQIGSSSWSMVAASDSHTVAIRSDNTLWGWGDGYLAGEGQFVSNIAALNRSSPVLVAATDASMNTKTWKAVSASVSHTLAISSENELYAWGRNDAGYVGKVNHISYVDGPASYIDSRGYLFRLGGNAEGDFGRNDRVDGSGGSPIQIGTKTWLMTSYIATNQIAIDTEYRLWAAGDGTNGLIGDNAAINRSSFVQIGASTDTPAGSFTFISSGYSRTTSAIHVSGNLYSWGVNSNGQVGDGTIITRSSPVQISSGNTFTFVSQGSGHAMAIRSDGGLFAWGNNAIGQLGDGTTINRSAPVKIGSSSWTQVAVGLSHTIALDVNGRIYTWGRNVNGELGLNNVANTSSPVQVGTSSWSVVGSTKGDFATTYAIRYGDGALFVWGTAGDSGLLGNGIQSGFRSSPVQIGTSSFTQISYGRFATVGRGAVAARDVFGFIHVWGNNQSSNPIGIINLTGSFPPISRVVNETMPWKIANTSNWIHVSAGRSHSLAINSNYDLYGWGNFAGTLPIQPFKYKAVTGSGVFFGSALTTSNTLHRWGNAGVLGGIRILAEQYKLLLNTGYELTSSVNWKIVNDLVSSSTDQAFTGIKNDGTLWGSSDFNTDGFVGDNTTINRSNIVQVGTDTDWDKLGIYSAVYTQHAIKTNGSLWGWGRGANGTIGLNSTISYSSPVQISTGNSFTMVDHGTRHTIALRSDGTIWTWGLNSNGELGHNDRVDRSQPTQVGSGSNWGWVGADGGPNNIQTFAIDNSGNAYAWGSLSTGFSARSSPTQVGSGLSWAMFSTGNLGLVGLTTDGAVYYWGRATEGQRGDNSTVGSDPIYLPGSGSGGKSFIQVFANYRAVYGIDSENNLYVWGSLDRGGTWTISLLGQSSPVQIGIQEIYNLSPTYISSNWKKVSAGSDYNVGIKTNNKLYTWGVQYEGTYETPATPLTEEIASNLIVTDAALDLNKSIIATLSTANTA